MSDAPPPAIEQRLAPLVPRLRALRVARGAARVLVAALAAAGFVLLLDAAAPLPAWARGLLLSAWLTATGVLVWRGVLVPWRADLSLADVAGELERTLPELGGRLRAVVSERPPGQPDALRAALIDDTARRAKSLDLARALPTKPVTRVVACAAAAVLAAAALAALVPDSGARLRRVAAPWHRPPEAEFRVVVTSGEPVVRRGDPVTLSAYAERTGPATPAEAVVVFRAAPGAPEAREAMASDGGAFHFTLPRAAADFEYRVEMGAARSDWFRVTALDPVELADGTRIEIVPPEYATAVQPRVLTTFTDLDGLAAGAVRFHLTFTRPAAAVHFDWRPRGAAKSELVAADLAPDRLRATALFPLRESGVLKLVLVRDADGKRLRTETAVAVRAARDEPPWFEEVSGVVPRPRTVRPGTRVPVAFVARDDLSVTAAALVYVVGPDESKRVAVPLPLTGGGTPRATGHIAFDLTGKGNEGDAVRVRIEVSDNRRADGGDGPQVAVYPPVGWSELRLTAAAPPLDQQDIVCRRDALRESLAAAATTAQEAGAEAAAAHAATAGGGALTGDQPARLNAARERVRAAAAALEAAATDAALAPELRPLAADVRAVAGRYLRPAEDALRRAEDDGGTRADALRTAVADLDDARARLGGLIDRNGRAARDRLDRAKLIALAAEQTALADAPPADAADAAERLARQGALLARLAAVVAESDALTAAANAAKVEEVRRLGTALADSAARLRDLDAAARDFADDGRAALGGAIAQEQEALAARAAAVLGTLDTAARLAGVSVPKADEFRRVADLAAAGKMVEALTDLEKHAQALTELAAAFEKCAADRADPKLAAKQLVLWQDDLRGRFEAATKDTAYGKLAAEPRAALRAEQKALRAAVEALSLPPEAAPTREAAAVHIRTADESLGADGAGAGTAMGRAAEGLRRLAADAPTVAERHARALRALDPLRQELDASGTAVDQVLRGPTAPDGLAKRLAPAADRQRKLIAGVAALDLPGLNERRARVTAALAAAASDLRNGSLLDIPASQAWARREFERLKSALEGIPSADAKADELHHALAALAAGLDAHGPALARAHVEPAVSVLQDAARQLATMTAPESPALLNDTRAAVQSAESAARDAAPDEARRRVRAAADAVGKLADRLNGYESDLDRINRLAALRRRAADNPKEQFPPADAQRQLGREGEELAYTRVGPAGQAHKKRALDLYARLRAKPDPDRIEAHRKALVAALDELAAKVADVAELAVADRPAPTRAAADPYLPSKPRADALRTLAEQVRALRPRVTSFATDFAARLRPAANNPLAPLAATQRGLALDALALARAAGLDPAPKAADAALLAADRVRVGRVLAAKEAGERAAAALRQLAAVGGNKPWAIRADELATRQEEVAAALGEYLTRPDIIAAQQVARAEELARESGAAAAGLERAARPLPPDDPTGAALASAAKLARTAERRLLDAAKKAAGGDTTDAETIRAAAEANLRDAAAGVARSAPPAADGVGYATGDALRAAEKAMRAALDALAPGGDAAAAPAAMRDAARALLEAAKRAGE